MKVSDIIHAFERIAPLHLAESWDNVGLLIGDERSAVRKLLLCIDLTAEVVEEARREKARMVMAYHPVIFKPVSRLTAGRTPAAYLAARAGLSVYSLHTAWDAAPGGINDVLAGVLGIEAPRPLEPSLDSGQVKLVVFTPEADVDAVLAAAFAAGAGRIGDYSECSFSAGGTGTFRGGEGSHPAIGKPGHRENVREQRLEILAPRRCLHKVLEAIRAAHSYETPAIDIYPLEGYPAGCGMGRIGELVAPTPVAKLISRIKRRTGQRQVQIIPAATSGRNAPVSATAQLAALPPVMRAACCAGAGGELLKSAAAEGATFFLTGEIRHHEALEASRSGMTVICLGHANSERLGLPRLAHQVRELLPGLTVKVSKADTAGLEIF